MLQKISAEDCANKGVLDLPDTPQFTSAEMRRRFDELSREVIIPIHNQNIDTLCAESAGEEIGCAAPAGVVPEPLPEEGKPTKLLPVLKGIITYLTNAFQAWAYSKAETDTAIGQKIVEIGAGDMAKAVYDPLLKQKAVAFADEVEETYQPNADPSLQTSNKTVAGAINEVNESVAALKNGTTAAGDAAKLGGKAAAEYLKRQTAATLYVSANTGSDTTGDGSAAKPYKTIQFAINTLNKQLVSDVSIQVADGAYAENVIIYGFFGSGNFLLKSTAGDSLNPADYDRCKINSIAVVSCSAPVTVLGFTLVNLTYNGWYGTSFHVFNSSSVGARIKSTFAAMNAANVHSGARVENSNITFATGTQISNKHYGIFASGNAHLLFQDIVVNNCTAALGSAASHIYFDWNTTQISGALYRSAGGLITKGAGVDV